jgi:hypothetical protein
MVSAISSLRPILSTVSIMPGMENLAPERQETSSGFSVPPNFLPVSFSISLHGGQFLLPHSFGEVVALGQVGVAGFGGDGEAGGNGHAQASHVGQVGALAAQQGAHAHPIAADVGFGFVLLR